MISKRASNTAHGPTSIAQTGARSRSRCGFRDPANLLMTSPVRNEGALAHLLDPDGGELVPPTSTINRSHHDVVSPSGKSVPRSLYRFSCAGIHVRRLYGSGANGRALLD